MRAAAASAAPSEAPADPAQAFAPALDAYKYLAFEDRFRGSRDEIRARMTSYLPFFEGASDVLDVGCGRGEFLELLAGAGISGRGLDLNHEMVETCRARGPRRDRSGCGRLSDVAAGRRRSAASSRRRSSSISQPAYLLAFLELAFHKLRPGGRLVLETLNPACWVAFFESYIRDITHVWPLHPETLQFLVVASGFTSADIEYRSPVADADKLQPVTATASMGPGPGRSRRLVQRQRREVEQPDLHVPRLRGHRDALTAAACFSRRFSRTHPRSSQPVDRPPCDAPQRPHPAPRPPHRRHAGDRRQLAAERGAEPAGAEVVGEAGQRVRPRAPPRCAAAAATACS